MLAPIKDWLHLISNQKTHKGLALNRDDWGGGRGSVCILKQTSVFLVRLVCG
jgi:hypothetical protein